MDTLLDKSRYCENLGDIVQDVHGLKFHQVRQWQFGDRMLLGAFIPQWLFVN